jgi:hypothetical protein
MLPYLMHVLSRLDVSDDSWLIRFDILRDYYGPTNEAFQSEQAKP